MTNDCQHGPYGLCRFCRYETNALEEAVTRASLPVYNAPVKPANAFSASLTLVIYAIVATIVLGILYEFLLVEPMETIALATVIFVGGASAGGKRI